MNATVENTYGALLLGAFLACWVLDVLHTCFIMASIWNYLIPHFGDVARVDFIPWFMSIVVTAILTILVHCFMARRIYKLTKNDWRITAPILILAVLRLFTTAEMIRIKSFKGFYEKVRWLFTLGLGLSSAVDVLITVTLCYKLRSSRTGSRGMDNIIDSLVLYTFENGSLTCVGTILSMICWLTMPHSKIFLGLHFMIAKLYANSLLATLNTRKALSDNRVQTTPSGGHVLPIIFPEFSGESRGGRGKHSHNGSESSGSQTVDMKLQISVQKTTDTRLDEEDLAMPAFVRTETPQV
ncbi:hypothetical protein PILCRDRAFT_819939 [Piloderma croceum F 1598]|uniref:DUF6534 domain-containing protein n=1 Tax=Piloderma croceum (strain F 1598) TaxID=765440 RepID=A0A0C3FY76_PILCF|nr:hypothetical protein PILCRDRAFT_819939 [Piloderma croceum F 1598]